jgi:hypothetical protein
MPIRHIRWQYFLFLIFLLFRSEYSLAFEKPFVNALRTPVQPTIDGKLIEECWMLGEAITNFTQVLPLEGAPPTEKTEVKFIYDENYLYVGIWCYDSEPNKIIAKQMQRDAVLRSDDYVKIALDTFGRQQFGYFFAINPAGARVDGQIQNFYVEKKQWDAIWSGKAVITHFGWTAEIAIPFKSISFDLSSGFWGCNIERVIRRKQEVIRWTAISPSREMTLLSDFGELRGITNIHQGLGLEFKPVMSIAFKDDKSENYHAWRLKPGLDVSYNITPSLTGQATFNTDFAEAEVDERMVNLTRFPLFYPEKREFFARDSALFSFAGIDYSPLPFYSRRIGLDADGKPVDIIAGGRLTGRFDNTSLAVINVQQDSHDDIKSKNLSVVRVSRGIWGSSSAGFIGTYGDPLSNGDAGLVGFDFNYINNEIFNSKQFIAATYLMVSQSDRMDGEDAAFGVDLDYPNEPLDLHTTFRQNGSKFEPALGFIDRRGVRSYRQAIRYVWRINTEYVRTISIGVLPTLKTDLSNRIVEEDHDLPFISISTPKDDTLYGMLGVNRDVVDSPFNMWDNTTIRPDDYRWLWGRITFTSSESRIISGKLSYRFGNFYDGTRNDYLAGISLKPSKHILFGISYEIRDIDLPVNSFIVRIFSARINLQFTPDLILNNTIQYDNDSKLVGINSRFRWTIKPGSDLFLTFNNGYLFEDWNFRMQLFETSLKVALTIRF